MGEITTSRKIRWILHVITLFYPKWYRLTDITLLNAKFWRWVATMLPLGSYISGIAIRAIRPPRPLVPYVVGFDVSRRLRTETRVESAYTRHVRRQGNLAPRAKVHRLPRGGEDISAIITLALCFERARGRCSNSRLVSVPSSLSSIEITAW